MESSTQIESIKLYGIRHHGAGSSRNLIAALSNQKPDVVIIECPADTQHLLPYVDQNLLDPPVAIMVYNQADLTEYAYYPFTIFSPEWIAIQYGIKEDVPILFFDLPQRNSFCLSDDKSIPTKATRFVSDPFTQMAQLAGFDDTERWWDEYIEQQETAPKVFEVVLELMVEMRSSVPSIKHINLVREAYMREQLRSALKNGFKNIAVVCGAWHTPALLDLLQPKSQADKKTLSGLKKVNTQATWVPWSYNRMARHTGYDSGVISPYWYEALFEAPEEAVFRWMSRAGKILNDLGHGLSPAHTIEGSRLTNALAFIRTKTKPGITELFDAVSTVHCRGNDRLIEKLRTKLLEGEKVGYVSDKIPTVPLRKDLEDQVKQARLLRDWKKQGLIEKKLDLRKATHLSASRLFHKLLLLEIPWGVEQEIDHNPLGTFHEQWDLEWLPDYEIKIIEASMWGNTLDEACTNFTLHTISLEDNFTQLGDLLYRVLHSHLPHLIEPVSKKIKDVGNLSNDAHLLMLLVPPLFWSMRYGDTAQLNTSAVTSLLEELFPRLCLLLPNQSQGISEDVAQDLFKASLNVHQAVQLTQAGIYQEQWIGALKAIGQAEQAHPLLKGNAVRILLAKKIWPENVFYRMVKFELSSLQDPFHPALFLEGLLYGGGWLLVHRPSLYQIVDEWFTQLDEPDFMQYLPILRRVFSTFSAPEKKVLFDMIDRERNTAKNPIAVSEKRKEIILPAFRKLIQNPD